MIASLREKVGGAQGALEFPEDSTLHLMSVDQLREVCVAKNVEPAKTKRTMLKRLEEARFGKAEAGVEDEEKKEMLKDKRRLKKARDEEAKEMLKDKRRLKKAR